MQHFNKKSSQQIILNDSVWKIYRRMLMPVSAPHIELDIDLNAIRKSVIRHHLMGACWTCDWDRSSGPWYWVICDDHVYDLDDLKPKVRRDIRRGLRRTTVKPVSLDWIAEHGYEVYAKAFARYAFRSPLNREKFQKYLFKSIDMAEPEGWAVFADKQLIAWGSFYIRDNVVFMDDLKYDHEYNACNAMNALHFTVVKHYLAERGFEYITSGARNVSHQTHIHDFQYRMGWRKAYCKLGLWLRPEINLLIPSPVSEYLAKIDKPFVTTLGRNIQSLSMLKHIARECSASMG